MRLWLTERSAMGDQTEIIRWSAGLSMACIMPITISTRNMPVAAAVFGSLRSKVGRKAESAAMVSRGSSRIWAVGRLKRSAR
jgi:hypothetical protein